ncbi:MAG: sulfatase-like hydrolase/transferase [Candidatus Aminicenantales bacterium]
MKKKALIVIIGAAAVIALFVIFVLLPGGASFARLRRGRDFNVILITLDTTRADKIGCYGCAEVKTPTIDGFAARGLRLDKCIAQTPLTLPSHTSILTGTFPLYHGVRDNGGFIVSPGLETMAEVFKKGGYQTAAFVAAYVLDSRWGLNQGFDYYFDQFDLSKFETVSLSNIQRPANEVMDEALPWLDKNKSDKFFAWIHLYDPHTPYEPPPPYDTEYAARPYLGEIAFADSQIARLWRFLEENKLTDKTFLVFAGDHGESLGQHQEIAHCFFVYQEAIHVPLIFVTPFAKLQGRTSSRPANLADIMPTILDMCGQPWPKDIQGQSLAGEFFGRSKASSDVLTYSETFYPRFHFGWSELQSVQNDRYQLIIATDMELYDLLEDPRELMNLIDSRPAVARTLRAQADELIARYSRNALQSDLSTVDEETREKLAALGYLGSFVNSAKLAGKKLANPKDKIGIFNDLSKARELGMSGKADKAIPMIKRIIRQDPDIVDAYFALGNIYFRERRFREAIDQFQIALALKPDDSFTVMNIANCYVSLRHPDQAEKFVLDYLKKGLQDSQLFFLLGNINYRQDRFDQAIPYFRQCLSLNSESASAYNALAAIYYQKDDLAQAESNSREAIRLSPKLSSVHYNLAQILEKKGQTAEAEAEYKSELTVTPSQFKACFNLARLYRREGRVDDEQSCLERGIKIAPKFPLNYFYLARIYLNRGVKFNEAVDFVQKGIGLKPDKSDLALAYFLLADLYNRLGDAAASDRYARLGQATAPAAEK